MDYEMWNRLLQEAFKRWQDTFPGDQYVAAREIELENRHGIKRITTELAHYEGTCCYLVKLDNAKGSSV